MFSDVEAILSSIELKRNMLHSKDLLAMTGVILMDGPSLKSSHGTTHMDQARFNDLPRIQLISEVVSGQVA